MQGFNNYSGEMSYISDWDIKHREIARRTENIKKSNKESFGSFNEELNAVWDNKCDVCYHRYSCKFNGKGTCPRPESYFTSVEHDAALKDEVLDKVIKKLENIDSCGWAMFSLCLIKEIVDDVKKGK